MLDQLDLQALLDQRVLKGQLAPLEQFQLRRGRPGLREVLALTGQLAPLVRHPQLQGLQARPERLAAPVQPGLRALMAARATPARPAPRGSATLA